MSVPSKLVEQRPDVRQAEEDMHAASAAVGVALADMLPQFAINADLGSSALKLGSLFSPYTGFWDAGASLTQTLFDAGALLHKKRAADAALDQAAAQYRAAVNSGVPECGRHAACFAGGRRCAEGERRRGARREADFRSRAAPARTGDDQPGRGAHCRANLSTGGAGLGPGPRQSLGRHGWIVSGARRRMVESYGGASL